MTGIYDNPIAVGQCCHQVGLIGSIGFTANDQGGSGDHIISIGHELHHGTGGRICKSKTGDFGSFIFDVNHHFFHFFFKIFAVKNAGGYIIPVIKEFGIGGIKIFGEKPFSGRFKIISSVSAEIGTADEDKFIHFFGEQCSKVLSIMAAHGVTDDIGFFQTNMVHKCCHIVSKEHTAVSSVIGGIGVAAATLIEDIYMEIFGQFFGSDGPGTAAVGNTVKKNHGFTIGLPHFHIGHGDAGGKFSILFGIDPIFLGNFKRKNFFCRNASVKNGHDLSTGSDPLGNQCTVHTVDQTGLITKSKTIYGIGADLIGIFKCFDIFGCIRSKFKAIIDIRSTGYHSDHLLTGKFGVGVKLSCGYTIDHAIVIKSDHGNIVPVRFHINKGVLDFFYIILFTHCIVKNLSKFGTGHFAIGAERAIGITIYHIGFGHFFNGIFGPAVSNVGKGRGCAYTNGKSKYHHDGQHNNETAFFQHSFLLLF